MGRASGMDGFKGRWSVLPRSRSSELAIEGFAKTSLRSGEPLVHSMARRLDLGVCEDDELDRSGSIDGTERRKG